MKHTSASLYCKSKRTLRLSHYWFNENNKIVDSSIKVYNNVIIQQKYFSGQFIKVAINKNNNEWIKIFADNSLITIK